MPDMIWRYRHCKRTVQPTQVIFAAWWLSTKVLHASKALGHGGICFRFCFFFETARASGLWGLWVAQSLEDVFGGPKLWDPQRPGICRDESFKYPTPPHTPPRRHPPIYPTHPRPLTTACPPARTFRRMSRTHISHARTSTLQNGRGLTPMFGFETDGEHLGWRWWKRRSYETLCPGCTGDGEMGPNMGKTLQHDAVYGHVANVGEYDEAWDDRFQTLGKELKEPRK